MIQPTHLLTIGVTLSIFFIALSIFLLHRQRVGSDRNTNGVIDRLIRTALQTGIAPLLFALAGLIAFSKIERFSLSLWYSSFTSSCSTEHELVHHVCDTYWTNLLSGILFSHIRSMGVDCTVVPIECIECTQGAPLKASGTQRLGDFCSSCRSSIRPLCYLTDTLLEWRVAGSSTISLRDCGAWQFN